jgi:hypothetical protein
MASTRKKTLFCILPVLARAAWGLLLCRLCGICRKSLLERGGALILILKSGFSKSRRSQQIFLSRPCKPIRCTKYALLRTFTQPVELLLCNKMKFPLLTGKVPVDGFLTIPCNGIKDNELGFRFLKTILSV